MKKLVSLLLVLIICISMTGCGKAKCSIEGCENEAIEDTAYEELYCSKHLANKKAFDASKMAYDKIRSAYEIVDQFSSDIYDVWKATVYNVKEIKDDDVNYLINTQGLFLTEEELRDAIAYTFVWYADPNGWENVSEEKKQEYRETAGSILRTMIRYYEKDFMSFCITSVTNAYVRNGKIDIAQAAIDEAKVLMKDLSDKYSDYEHYPNLKGYYTTTISLFDFCKNPTGSFDQYTVTLNDYKNEARNYISDLDYIFED